MKKIALSLIFFILISIIPISASASISSSSISFSSAYSDVTNAEFDSAGNLYLGAKQAGELEVASTYMFDMEAETEIAAPFFTGDIFESTGDGSGGFYVYGDFKNAESSDPLVEAEPLTSHYATNIAYINPDGEVMYLTGFETNGDVLAMQYIPEYDALFMAGTFEIVFGQTHRYITCINPSTGDFCTIGEYDWEDNTGFFSDSANIVDISYDHNLDRLLLIGSKLKQYKETSPETNTTVLDPANPTENIAPTYLNLDPQDLEDRTEQNNGTQILYFDTEQDLDGNEVTEKFVYQYNYPKIWVYVDNGTGYVSNTEISLFGIPDPSLFVDYTDSGNDIYIASYDFETDPYNIAISKIPYTNPMEDIFSMTLSLFNKTYPVTPTTTLNSSITGAALSENGTAFVGGFFNYDETNNNFIGFIDEEVQVSKNVMRNGVSDFAESGDNILLTGPMQIAKPELANRSIIKIDPETGAYDEDFDVQLLDGFANLVVPEKIHIYGDYLYVYASDTEIAYFKDISEDNLVSVASSNLFRINLLTNSLDEEFFANIEGEPTFNFVETDDTSDIYVGDSVFLFKIDSETGEIDSDWSTNFENSELSWNEIKHIYYAEDGYLYVAFTSNGDPFIARADANGNFETIYTDVDIVNMEAMYYYDNTLFIAYHIEEVSALKALTIAEDGTATQSTDLDFSNYYLEHVSNEPFVSSIAIDQDRIYVTGYFDSLTNSDSETQSDATNVAIFDLGTGSFDDDRSSIFLNIVETNPGVGVTKSDAGDYIALFGDYSFLIPNLDDRLSASPLGLLVLESIETNILTEIQAIPSRVKISDAVYYFEMNGTDLADPYFEVCGDNVDVQVDLELGTVTFDGLQIGQTYECSFFVRTDFGNSNSLQVGPFLVVANSSSGSGSRNNKSELEPLTYEQEVAAMLAAGIVTENPTNNTNKCEALVMMSRAFKWDLSESTETLIPFTDIPVWCDQVVAYALKYDIVQGRTASTLGMETPVTRDEVALMIYRELKRKNYKFKDFSNVKFAGFKDTLTPWSEEAIMTLYKEGIIKGFSDGTFGGSKNILKQDLGVMLFRML